MYRPGEMVMITEVKLQLKLKDAVFLITLEEARELHDELGRFCDKNKPVYTTRGDDKVAKTMRESTFK